MQQKSIDFTPTLFYEYAICPHWIWHDRFSDPSEKDEMPELTLRLFEQGVLNEQDYIKDLTFSQVKPVNLKLAFAETMRLMQAGAELIYQGVIQYEADGILYQGRPDLLKKVAGKSTLGDYYYQPIEIKSTKEIKTEQKYQLVFYGLVLKQVQGLFPNEASIINKEKQAVLFLISQEEQQKTELHMRDLMAILQGSK